MNKKRCAWVNQKDDLSISYHDNEWGVPLYDEERLFEFLILEGMQAGLSWSTILKKRAAFRIAFADFNPLIISKFDASKVAALLNNADIIRNRLKIQAAIANAKAYLEVKKEFGSFSKFIWQFVGGRPLQNNWCAFTEVPATTQISDKMSQALKERGFKFVGSTICYAFMQAVGMVNDHTIDCFRHKELLK